MKIVAVALVALVAAAHAVDPFAGHDFKRLKKTHLKYGVPAASQPSSTAVTLTEDIEVIDAKQTLELPAVAHPRTPFHLEAEQLFSKYGVPDFSNFPLETDKPALPQNSYGAPLVTKTKTVTEIIRPHKTYDVPRTQEIINVIGEPTAQAPINVPDVVDVSIQPTFENVPPKLPLESSVRPVVPHTSYGVPFEHQSKKIITEVVKPHQTYGVPEPEKVIIEVVSQPHQTYGVPSEIVDVINAPTTQAPVFENVKIVQQPPNQPINIPFRPQVFAPSVQEFIQPIGRPHATYGLPPVDCHQPIRPSLPVIIENVRTRPQILVRPQPQFVPYQVVPQPELRPVPLPESSGPGFGAQVSNHFANKVQKIQQHFSNKVQKSQQLLGAASQKVSNIKQSLVSVPQKLYSHLQHRPTFFSHKRPVQVPIQVPFVQYPVHHVVDYQHQPQHVEVHQSYDPVNGGYVL